MDMTQVVFTVLTHVFARPQQSVEESSRVTHYSLWQCLKEFAKTTQMSGKMVGKQASRDIIALTFRRGSL